MSSARTSRIVRTIVFTDIARSTELAREMGDREWRAQLDRHDALLRRRLKRFHGREVKTLGDTFLAMFGTPADAAGWALDVPYRRVRGPGSGHRGHRRSHRRALPLRAASGVGDVEGARGPIFASSIVADLRWRAACSHRRISL